MWKCVIRTKDVLLNVCANSIALTKYERHGLEASFLSIVLSIFIPIYCCRCGRHGWTRWLLLWMSEARASHAANVWNENREPHIYRHGRAEPAVFMRETYLLVRTTNECLVWFYKTEIIEVTEISTLLVGYFLALKSTIWAAVNFTAFYIDVLT
jgi:hypothetical protein